MLIQDFKIDTEFVLNGKRYRVTDVGSRGVVAIRIDQVEVVRHHLISEGGGSTRRILPYDEADKDGWFNGPPYAVAEHVFDENDLPACESV